MIIVYIIAVMISMMAVAIGFAYSDRYIKKKGCEQTRKLFSPIVVIPATVFCAAYSIFSVYSLSMNNFTGIDIIQYVTAVCGLLLSSITDIKLKLIPNVFCVALVIAWALETAVGCIFCEYSWQSELIASIIGGAFGGGLLLIGRLFSKNGMGMGDIKLLLSIGLLLKFDKTLALLFWGLIFSLFYGISLIVLKKAKMSSQISMAPFFLSGAVMLNISMFVSYVLYGGA